MSDDPPLIEGWTNERDDGASGPAVVAEGKHLVRWGSFNRGTERFNSWCEQLEQVADRLNTINIQPGWFTEAQAYQSAVHDDWRDPTVRNCIILSEAFRTMGELLQVARGGYEGNESALAQQNGADLLAYLDGVEPVRLAQSTAPPVADGDDIQLQDVQEPDRGGRGFFGMIADRFTALVPD